MVVRHTACLLLRSLVLHRPHSDRLVEEMVTWMHASDCIPREIEGVQTSNNKRGSALKKRTSAAVLSLIAMLNIESTDRELAEGKAVSQSHNDQAGEGTVPAPRALLYLSTAFSTLHPGVIDSWLRWASRAKDVREEQQITSTYRVYIFIYLYLS